MLHIALRLLGIQAGDRVADRDPLIERGERASPEPVAQGRLPEQKQAERRGLVHAHVRQAPDALQALAVEQVRLIDDQHDLLAPLRALGCQQLLGLGNQRGVMKAGGAAQRGDDHPVDPAQPHPRRAEVDDRVRARNAGASNSPISQ